MRVNMTAEHKSADVAAWYEDDHTESGGGISSLGSLNNHEKDLADYIAEEKIV